MTIYIIGYGITGCYLSYKLNKLYPHERIICIEKDTRYGGRIHTIYWNGYTIDLGAWRYSPVSHTHVQSLVSKYNISTVSIPNRSLDIPSIYVPNNISLGFVQYLISIDIDPNAYVDAYGYNIYRDDISSQLISYENTIDPNYVYMKHGYISLMHSLIQDMNDNVHIYLGVSLLSISDGILYLSNGKKIQSETTYVTIPPNALSQVYPTDILSSMIGYSAIRIYLLIDKRIDPKMYITTYPLRKIYVLNTGIILIYTDAPDARVVESLMKNSIDIVSHWLSSIFNTQVSILKYTYQYWNNGIYFWRPVRTRNIGSYPFQYLSGDISSEPGWVDGSIKMIDSLYL